MMEVMYRRLPLLAFLLSPLVLTYVVFKGDLHLVYSSLSLFPFHVLSQLGPLDHHFNGILLLDVVVGVMVLTFMEMVVLLIVCLRCLSNMIRGSDSSIFKIYVGIGFVNLLPTNSKRSVLVISAIHTSVRLVLLSVRLLPY